MIWLTVLTSFDGARPIKLGEKLLHVANLHCDLLISVKIEFKLFKSWVRKPSMVII